MKVQTILDGQRSTTEPMAYLIEGGSFSSDAFVPLAIFTKREDVEAFETNDPDLMPGSLTAQLLTIDAIVNLLVRNRLGELSEVMLRIEQALPLFSKDKG